MRWAVGLELTNSKMKSYEGSIPSGDFMKFTIFKDFTFEAAHSLPHLPESHKCHHVHGHSYKVTVFASGPINESTGFVVDYADLSDAWSVLYDQLDHKFINDVPGLEISTSEALSQWIYRRMRKAVPQVDKVIVRETATAGCEYTE